MIPQNFKDILSNTENVGFYQTLALVLFILFFVSLIIYVFSKPKKYYNEEEHAPLDDDQDDFNLKN
ncbi:cbb3-type cytochrome c oxidase subunit 3 [Chryseobacterium sp.]|uniref:cbb3-type cytochrome oxidase subunit 3 n=1 Tax=Chryseobacterium sp. TaxID=1871047 RepID=UPI0028A1BB37|nr:cbb3-type cytochrome c oxidase subunit 3 [Chryseobacterium sp.]